ncbi:MAG TPA: peptidase M24 family protein [Acidimicrobiaceae bacterium]|nr:peptidase M24 family protein [Acidimicrobiaceae bacterium]HCB36904.1 peptidase M24 family protein [Acidimicrobiaceae bacterium]
MREAVFGSPPADGAPPADAAPPVSALLLTDLVSLGYLTGFTGSAGKLLVDAGRALFLTDGRYRIQLADELAAAGLADVVSAHVDGPDGQHRALLAWVAEAGSAAVLGVEADTMAWADALSLSEQLGAATPPVRVEPTRAVVAGLRSVKDSGEVERIAAAATIADNALADVVDRLTRRPTEREFARELDNRMLAGGAEALSFETICASGPNSALPHARPSERVVGRGDLVVVDFGAVVDGYHSDMTRTFCVGEPDAEQSAMLETVARAQDAGVAAVRAGVPASAVDRACREVVEAAGMADEFVHGTGHGVGLVIHEEPWVGAHSTTTLVPGHVVTVEPGVYRHGVGGVRVEDTVVVTDGEPRRLTNAPKDPVLG